jgi:rfaE bifunctional protein nucleotidyltransferase chain/domain
MSGPAIVVVGDVILDRDIIGVVERVCPDAPAPVLDVRRREERPGGAGLAALLLAEAHQVILATCLGDDEAGAGVRDGLRGKAELLQLAWLAEGTRSVTRLRSGGQCLARMDENGAGLPPDVVLDQTAVVRLDVALRDADSILVADYGAGVASHPQLRAALAGWATRRPIVWDPHPKGAQPVPGTRIATPNRAEAIGFAARVPGGPRDQHDQPLDQVASGLRKAWAVHAVAATDGADGVFTALADSPPLFTPAPFAHSGDTCGAGDRFAGRVAAELATGAVITEAVQAAVQDVARWLAHGGIASVGNTGLTCRGGRPPSRTAADLDLPAEARGLERVEAVRAAGGRVVATGGCFDVLHAGHVASLRAARLLGDCLVVLLNSDASVRRLKGPGRPVHLQADRAEVLQALACVDAVLIFDEDTPLAALDRLRPHVWAKGSDYAGATLPETGHLRAWGGRVVLLPYLTGRSTTAALADLSREDLS